MPIINTFPPGRHPQLALEVLSRENNRAALLVKSYNQAFEELLPARPAEELAGADVFDLFPEDSLALEEWLECLDALARGERAANRSLVQYFHFCSALLVTCLSVEGAELSLHFYPTGEGDQDLWRMMEQRRTANSVRGGGGSWDIDLAERTVFLSRRMARLLHLGDTATTVPLDRFISTVHPGDLEAVKALLGKLAHETKSVFSRSLPELGELHLHSCVLPLYGADLRLRGIAARSMDVTDNKQQELPKNARDPLTGLCSRIRFDEELSRIQKEGIRGTSLAILDLNGLRLINETFGHQAGDKVLTRIAEIIAEACGEDHMACRIGGDEFAVLAADTPPEEMERLCQRISEVCGEQLGERMSISISWGIAHRPDTAIAMATVFRQAETHMIGSKLLERRSMHSQVIAPLLEALKLRNAETSDHMLRMESMAAVMGKELRLSAAERDRLVLLASMHDIGKVSIPDHILAKPGKLTQEEWATMRTHSESGYRIAVVSQELASIADDICCHHERWDGGGYPFGKAGEKIPLLSRIISVADAYDVMTHKRVYKESVSHPDALEEIRRCTGSQFDPEVVRVFLRTFGALTQEETLAYTRQMAPQFF